MSVEGKLRRLQLTQLEILKVFDRICREQGLRYSLYAGSLLGAVRHHGFIPWDDDLDVCMPRADYERFLALWDSVGPEGYVLQNKENSVRFDQSFTKLRKNHTAFLQEEREKGSHHTGIFLDIFPIDRIPKGGLNRAVFRWNCMVYQLLTREFVPPRANILVRAGSGLILACVPGKFRGGLRRRILSRITKYSSDPSLELVFIETMASLTAAYPPDMADRYTALHFEDGEFMCFQDWDSYLRRKFGGYMQLPPVEDRVWKHHPILLDFEHNWEELNP